MFAETLILQSKQPCKKPVSSELLFAADSRSETRKRDNPEGAWSLFSGTEAQDHLYVTAIFFSCFSCPVTCNREEKFVLVQKFNKNRYPPRQRRQNLIDA